jgi:TrmH family RNA methyltransferase
MTLTSLQNPLLKQVRRAVEDGRALGDGAVAAEGPHLLAEALRGSWRIQQVFCSAEAREPHRSLLAEAARRGVEVTEVTERAFKAMSDTVHGQGILSLLVPSASSWADLSKPGRPLVILDGIQDPGNAGTIVRSAEAFGGAGVVLTEGCARIANGKFLRSSAGSIFRLPFLDNVPRATVLREVEGARQTLFALMTDGAETLFTVNLTTPFALVVGSEGSGVSPLLLKTARTLAIPTQGVESLNAAIACSIALFEAARQRACKFEAARQLALRSI